MTILKNDDWKDLAVWANETPRPTIPEIIPGLPGINKWLLLAYQERLVAWKVGKAEALMYGLEKEGKCKK